MHLNDATLLIVDDEAGLLKIFAKWFEREGCRVLTAENGVRALDVMAANHVDLIVSDIRMPLLDGIGLAKRLQQRDTYVPKIIFISGFADIGERDAFDLGVEALLAKPIVRPDLISAARRSLLEREELWRDRPGIAPGTWLRKAFPSLSDAKEQELIAFGRGGLCARCDIAAKVEDAIGLDLEFTADKLGLIGQGIVRWIDRADAQIGIEITYVEDAHRAWVAELAKRNELAAFIPRSSSSLASRGLRREPAEPHTTPLIRPRS